MRVHALMVLMVFNLSCRSTPVVMPAPDKSAQAADERRRLAVMTEIAKFEALRKFEADRTSSWLSDSSESVQLRALVALGRLQDVRSISLLAQKLTDSREPIRMQAAFALGLVAQSWTPLTDAERVTVTEPLLGALKNDQSDAVRRMVIEALSKTKSTACIKPLTERLTSKAGDSAAAALALGVLAKNGTALDNGTLVKLDEMLKNAPPVNLQLPLVYALAQSKNPLNVESLRSSLTAADPDVRGLALKGLGDTGNAADVPAIALSLADPVERVVAEAARTLVKLAQACKSPKCPALDALQIFWKSAGPAAADGQRQVSHSLLASLQARLPASTRNALGTLVKALRSPRASTLNRTAAWLDCRASAAIDAIDRTLLQSRSCGSGLVSDTERLSLGLSVLAETEGDNAKLAAQLVPLLSHESPRVRSAAADAIGAAHGKNASTSLRKRLTDADQYVQAHAASALARIKDMTAVPDMLNAAGRADAFPDVASSFAEAFGQLHAEAARPQLQAWLKSPSASLRAAAAAALETLGDKGLRVEPIARDLTHEVTDGDLAAMKQTSLVVTTAKGAFEIALDVEQAPKTSAHFIRLTKAKYFDGLTFHRVVPNFVAQGGDPHGDGEGGPGYSIACEINHRRYERGTVGMALSGKDTGGSQFFVTLSPQPHLDGRYTTFGHVVSGMETVDALVEGDVMTQVTVKSQPTQ